MNGWIKLHRSLLDWEWWDDHNATRLLIYLLCAVNYEPKKWKGLEVPEGTIITSFEKLADATGMTTKQIRGAMQKLENSGEVARKRARKGQAVTLTKWEKLQGLSTDEGKQQGKLRASSGQVEGKKRATTKEGKEVEEIKEGKKKEETGIVIFPEIKFDEFWDLYDKKVDRVKCEKKWNQLRPVEKSHILDHAPKYVKATPDKQYRKNPLTYLNSKTWEDEDLPTLPNKEKSSAKKESFMDRLSQIK